MLVSSSGFIPYVTQILSGPEPIYSALYYYLEQAPPSARTDTRKMKVDARPIITT
ncbi:hypothetical protein An15g06830 [Aspergillus niger]|uniref:Uncharacterized protein n=2 Tax=Aspergillus niger TaxID=5061 RepID=A2R668_ASPNC|nr:hypothetical protein An15g06830 [Aspergillus niger]CAK42635.1 hypothetical protein An15g06830 [Aspergillus niger]